MPEFHSVQTYVQIKDQNLRPYMERYLSAIGRFGFNSSALDRWASKIASEPPDNELDYISIDCTWGMIACHGLTLRAAPLTSVWSSSEFPELGTDWLELELLFHSDEIMEFIDDDCRYIEGVSSALWTVVEAFGRLTVDAGSFLTNEVQDGQPWEGQFDRSDKRWKFDMAWLPDEVTQLYEGIPNDFFVSQRHGGLALAAGYLGNTPPWIKEADT